MKLAFGIIAQALMALLFVAALLLDVDAHRTGSWADSFWYLWQPILASAIGLALVVSLIIILRISEERKDG